MSGARGRILVADDEPSVLEAFARMLRGEGYEVEAVRNGREAVEAFAPGRFDLVVLDYAMPEMNGAAACERIRAADGAVQVVFLTASATDALQVRAFAAGADDFIDKMRFDDSVFLARVARAVERSRLLAAPRRAAGPAGSVRIGDTSVDVSRMTVESPAGRTMLSRHEATLFALLASSPGRVFPPGEVIERLYGAGAAGEAAAVRMLVKRLRAKLGAAGGAIGAVRGAGYRLDPAACGAI